ncbi:MAG: hypothetical protein ACFE8J_07745 [Candidatus Heimdallarchaeota archaeon]
MDRKIDTSEQFLEFYKRKGDYLVELSENHFKNKEYKKTLELLNQAYAMYQKGNCMQDAENVKQKFQEIKQKYFTK